MTAADISKDSLRNRMLSLVRPLVHAKLGADGQGTDAEADVRLLDLNLVDDLGLDSVQILDLLMTVEQEFQVQLDAEDADLDKLMKVGALVEFVARGSRAAL